MRRIIASLIIHLCLALNFAHADPNQDSFEKIFGSCGDPCTIRYNVGGFNKAFYAAAEHALEQLIHIRIDGPCYSSCVLFADFARPLVCITTRAVFGLHMGYQSKTQAAKYKGYVPAYTWKGQVRLRPPHSDDIDQWAVQRGGYPYESMLIMRHTDALAFWPQCVPYPAAKPRGLFYTIQT